MSEENYIPIDGIADQIYTRRMELGLSQSAVCRETGLTRNTLVKLETGRNVLLSTLLMVCEFLDIRLYYTLQDDRGYDVDDIEDLSD